MPGTVPSLLETNAFACFVCVVLLPLRRREGRKERGKKKKKNFVRSLVKGRSEHCVFLVGNGNHHHHHHNTHSCAHIHTHTGRASNTQRAMPIRHGPPVPPQWHAACRSGITLVPPV
ncbi:hypothetical protein CGRA01v4_02349 [Colletotrichum graminicola]|nr:hypothetical protein CGRA01v4_02349 [Colletotrichum graminicola]